MPDRLHVIDNIIDGIPRAERLLLVDDEDGIRTVLGITLADKGYAVTTAASGQEALDAFAAGCHPIVLTDIKMPGMDGIALLREIKDQSPETEVIMITGHGDMDLAVTSMQHGAADFVSKPIVTEALDVALRRAEERIHLRRRIREHTEDLERLVAERTEELLDAERMAAVGRIVTDLSHTIKNIASGLEGGIYVLSKGIELENEKYTGQGWEVVQGGVEKVKKLSLALLNFARFGRITPRECDPATPAREAVDLMRSRAVKNDVRLGLDLDAAPKTARLDHDATVRLLLNLLENAVDAVLNPEAETAGESAAAEKTVTLTLRTDGPDLVYTVRDTGPGLGKQARQDVFEGFFTTKGSAGTGIGLMTCKKIAEQHGGSITLTDAEDGGCQATVRLPLPPSSP